MSDFLRLIPETRKRLRSTACGNHDIDLACVPFTVRRLAHDLPRWMSSCEIYNMTMIYPHKVDKEMGILCLAPNAKNRKDTHIQIIASVGMMNSSVGTKIDDVKALMAR